MIFVNRPKNRQKIQAFVQLCQTASHLLLFLLALLPALAISSDCAELPPSSVSIKRQEAPVTENLQYSYKVLKGLGASYTRQDIEVLGLARGMAITRFDMKSTILTSPDKQWECASISLSVTYGFSPMTVYVGKEFPKGSCAHNEIMQHEMLHVRAYTEHAKKIEPEITESLRQRFERSTPWRGAAGTSTQKLQAEIDERWIPYLKRMLDRVNIEQRLIDSPEEYARVASSCDGAIKQRISASRR
ncbi:hypothetical protein [Azonexus sp.]|uniref:hypothetical protein n=1 Tax=Azonexus sp. TaxID=1872668 RepID=UPI0027BA774A|nr:hypothetical protein [Azonexus sp.]